MSREVRKVPANWKHPKNESGKYIPLLGDSFKERAAQWDEGFVQWEKGFYRSYEDKAKREPKTADMTGSFTDWNGERPDEKDYMPDWPEAERTHYQMYSTTSEGVPISPVMETPEALARWLADNNASAFADRGASYEQWLATIQQGWVLSAGISPKTGLVSGVEVLRSK